MTSARTRARQNDRGHLLNLVKGGAPLPDASPSNFLSWYPQNDGEHGQEAPPRSADHAVRRHRRRSPTAFAKLVTGVEQNGCGLEAQMESWYRFLVQPDPWAKVTVDANNQADLGGPVDIDVDLLTQRADFLRPDSLVAVILLTDEDDSSVDPLVGRRSGLGLHGEPVPRLAGLPRRRQDDDRAPRHQRVRHRPGLARTARRAASPPRVTRPTPRARRSRTTPSARRPAATTAPTEDQLNSRFSQQLDEAELRHRPAVPDLALHGRPHEEQGPGPHDRARRQGARGRQGSRHRRLHRHAASARTRSSRRSSRAARATRSATCRAARARPDLIFFAVVGGVPNDLLHFDPQRSGEEPHHERRLGQDPRPGARSLQLRRASTRT